jgi:RNA polymerase sigma-70 factor (ECF subfamily)
MPSSYHPSAEPAAEDLSISPASAPIAAEDLLRSAFKYQDALVSYAYALLQDWALAQDAVQETFIVLQKKHAEFRAGANVYTWARQIVRFEALNMLRSRKREACFVDDELFSLVEKQFELHMDQEAVGHLEVQKAALQQCMGRLDQDALKLLLGFYKDSLPCERLAALRQKSVNAIRLSLSRIRAKLRECVRHRLAFPEGNR